MRIRPVAAGTLPDDLVEAIRGGTVTLTETDDCTIVFRDTRGAVTWHCSRDVAGEPHTFFRHQHTGASGTAQIPRFSTVKRTDVKHMEAPLRTHTTNCSADLPPTLNSTLMTTPVTLSDIMQQHRALALKVVHFLAPAPRSQRDLLCTFTSENADTLNAVLQVLTVVNCRGQRELEAAGYELVDIESYDSRAVKQQVANLALPKVAHNKALWDRFSLYADRDVMLDACSRGVMKGLGNSSKRRRNRDGHDDEKDDDDDDDDDNDVDERASRRTAEEPNHLEAFPLLTSLEQSDIRWGDGDISKEKWVMSSAVKEVLARRQKSAGEGSATCRGLASMPVMNASQLAVAQKDYAILLKEYQTVYDILKRLEDVSEAARGWSQTNGSRFSDGLRGELLRWFEMQEGPRSTLSTALDILHRSLYQLKREIEDYVNLRDWGVLA